MKLKLIWICLCAAMLAGCQTANQGAVLCRNTQIERDASGLIRWHPFSTTQTKYKAAELPTMCLYGYSGKHVRIEVVNAAEQVVDYTEGDVDTPMKMAEKDPVDVLHPTPLRRVVLVYPLKVAKSGMYAARVLVDGQPVQTTIFEVE